MSQPKSNEEIIADYYNNFPECPQDLIGCTLDQEDVDEFNRARKRGEAWLRTILTQKDAELQKALERERTRISDYLKSQRYRDQPANDESEDWVVDWDDVAYIVSYNHHSELDQPIKTDQ